MTVLTVLLKNFSGCRCGQNVNKNSKAKNTKRYVSQKRCSCIVKLKKCCVKCKCVGRCGGVVCKTKIVKNRNFEKSPGRKKVKNVLQKSKEKLCTSGLVQDDTPNFLEICFLCTIIHFFRSGSITTWDPDTVYQLYIEVIDSLLLIGFIIPLRKLTKYSVWKRVEKLKKQFD